MPMHFIKNTIKIASTFLGIVILMNVAQSASFNSGKTKKKSSNRSTSLNFTLHKKSTSLITSNGFTFKGGVYTFNSQKSSFDIQLKSAYYSKGNNIYVQPLKHKVIISKFKSPQKPIY
jgi:hypothetical protein